MIKKSAEQWMPWQRVSHVEIARCAELGVVLSSRKVYKVDAKS